MKRITHLILIFICIFMLCGCNKEQLTMSIGRDKSMVCNFDFLLLDDYIESSESARNSLVLQATKYQTYGYSVSSKKDNGYSGYTFTKKFNNIDELSNNNGEEILLNDFIEGKDLNKTFKLEKGLLRNIYTANFTFKVSNEIINEMVQEKQVDNNSDVIVDGNNENTVLEPMAFTNDNVTSTREQMDFVYTVVLPYSAIKSNANDTSNGKKILSWKVLENKDINISYSFPIYNLNNILIVLGVGMVVVIAIIIILSKLLKRKKATKETLIHTDYDSSIVGQIEETTTEESIPQGPVNHEFNVPGEGVVNNEVVENTALVSEETYMETPQMDTPNMAPVNENNQNMINQ